MLLRFILLFVLASGLVACGKKKDNKTSVRRDRNTRVNPNQPQNSGGQGNVLGSASWGEITEYQTHFQESVYGLIAASSNPYETVGQVSGQSGANTGVRFIGTVQSHDDGSVSSGALRIVIWDSLVNEQSLDPIVFDLNVVDGDVATNGPIELVFQDEYGYVEFYGRINGNDFEGQVSYTNTSHYDNSQDPVVYDLGWFRVEKCGFFICN